MELKPALPAIAVAALLTLTGCGAESPAGGPQDGGPQDGGPQDGGPQDGGNNSQESSDSDQSASDPNVGSSLDGEGIRSALKAEDFECEVGDFFPSNVTEVFACRIEGAKLIFNKYDDLNKRQQHFEESVPPLCDDLGYHHVWWATSGDWVMLPAGGSEKQVETFRAKTESMGFELHDTDCA